MVVRMEVTDSDKYVPCYRCGINMGLWAGAERVFCCDCNHPDLIGVFRPLDYGWIFERN